MTSCSHQESAKIYQFPLSRRVGALVRRDDMTAGLDLRSSLVRDAATGSGWYHEAAVLEATLADAGRDGPF